ncbi:MAG: hypothetical protein ABI809_04555 [Caldimonas sp.]
MTADDAALTAWIAGLEPPRREGVYMRHSPAGPYSCWSGDRWFGDAAVPEAAAASRQPSKYRSAPWRGLATAPSEPCWSCRGHTVIDRGYDAESDVDLIDECIEC